MRSVLFTLVLVSIPAFGQESSTDHELTDKDHQTIEIVKEAAQAANEDDTDLTVWAGRIPSTPMCVPGQVGMSPAREADCIKVFLTKVARPKKAVADLKCAGLGLKVRRNEICRSGPDGQYCVDFTDDAVTNVTSDREIFRGEALALVVEAVDACFYEDDWVRTQSLKSGG